MTESFDLLGGSGFVIMSMGSIKLVAMHSLGSTTCDLFRFIKFNTQLQLTIITMIATVPVLALVASVFGNPLPASGNLEARDSCTISSLSTVSAAESCSTVRLYFVLQVALIIMLDTSRSRLIRSPSPPAKSWSSTLQIRQPSI
jgi:hypothetical protein